MGTAYNTNVVTDGIKFYWDAANRRSYPGTGTVWTDVVKGKTGTLDNATFSNQKGGYVEFDGTDDSVEISNDADFTMPAGDWTICVWCADLGGYWDKRHIVGTYGSYPKWVIRDTDDLAAGWAFVTNSGDGWERAYSTVDIQDTDDEWHYLVVTGSAGGSSGSLKLYTDGVDTSLSSSYAVESITRSTTTIYMGIASDNGHDFMGYIASVAIYSRILTPAEVKQNYEATKSRFAPRITKSGLVGNWDAGDPESYNGGSTWKDTANDNNGTLSGDTFFNTAGGGSFTFNSADDYVTIANESNFDIGTACTITAWVYLDSLGDSDYGRIIDKASALSSSTLDGFHFHCNTSNSFGAAVGCSTTNARSVSATSVLSLNTWMHLVMVFNEDGSKKIKQYKDGVKLTLATDTAGAGSIDNSSVSPRIGNYAGDTSRSFDGDIAVVRFYDKALSAAEILDNYQKTKGRFGH